MNIRFRFPCIKVCCYQKVQFKDSVGDVGNRENGKQRSSSILILEPKPSGQRGRDLFLKAAARSLNQASKGDEVNTQYHKEKVEGPTEVPTGAD